MKSCSWLGDLQSGRFICLIVMLVFGCFSITTTCLLVRSDKRTEIENVLTLHGDYDEIIYNIGIGFENSLSSSKMVNEIGLYYELGTISNENETESFKAVALKDEISEDIYHMTCIRGGYPKKDNEIAIDVSVANTFGIAPYPGETVFLKLYDSEGRYIETRELVISGVFKCSSNEALGGWTRCPDFAFHDTNTYSMPAVFFNPSNLDTWHCTKETVFFRSSYAGGEDLNDEVSRVLIDSGESCMGFEYNYRRNSGYSWFAGLGIESEETISRNDIDEAVNDGLFKKDFYSAIVFPFISMLVIVTEVISLHMLSKNIIADRKERYAILRSVGMSSKRIIRDLVIEMLAFGFTGAIIGIGLGYGAHLFLVRVLNEKLHLRLYDGIRVDRIVKQITFDPIFMSFLACVFSLVLALIIPLYRLYRMYPAELLSASNSMFVGKKGKNRQKITRVPRRWLGLLNRRIDLHDGSTMLVMMVVLSAALFGYVFFRAFAEQATVEVEGYKNLLGIDGNGYVVTRSSELDTWSYVIPNRHDAGVIPSFPELVENNPNVEESWSVINNESTRMVFDEEPDESMKQLLGNRLMNICDSDDPYVKELKKAEGVIFEHTGYDPNVYMYQLPTVGLTTKEMNDLEGEVVAGQIDIEKIRSGEEVVLAVPQELQDLCLQHFPVGSMISFDDILLTDEEEHLNFHTLNDAKWVVYDKEIETANGMTRVIAGAFGTRYGINSKVGAIVVLRNEEEINEYLTTGSSWIHQWRSYENAEYTSIDASYGMSILCLADSFANWGLPDRNFTSVRVRVKDDCDIYEFDEFWYKGLSGSVDVQTKSTFDYLDEISAGQKRVMAIFFSLLAVLIILGSLSITSGLYTKTRSNSARFQTLRRTGLSVHQASIMIYTQNMFYPIIGTLTAIIPIYYVQGMLNSMHKKIEAGELDILTTPWYSKIPYWADLFSYNFIPALICCLLLGNILILIGTLPQILYLRKMKMIETREE